MNELRDYAAIPLERALARIRAAARVIAPHARRTPTVYSHTFSEFAGADVWLKLENLQRTGSFKLRGALNKIESLSDGERARGLVAASAGNHAQGVALAARLRGVKATIVMPEATPLIKIQRTEGYGAEVVLRGQSYDKSQHYANELARERGLTLIHPFDDAAIIEGQGTIALEILEEIPAMDTLVVPIGGGGLISGIALAIKAVRPKVRVIGVQAAGAAAMVASVRAGRRVVIEKPETIADGIRVGAPGELTFPLVQRLVDECITVEEGEITDAVVQAMEKSKIVAETGGAAGLAALLAGKIKGAGCICAVVCGGNIDLNQLARIIEHGLSHGGRQHLVCLRMTDTPGQLVRVLSILGEEQCNVLDVQHYRSGWKVPIGFVDVEILVETRRATQGAQVEAVLRASGFDVRA